MSEWPSESSASIPNLLLLFQAACSALDLLLNCFALLLLGPVAVSHLSVSSGAGQVFITWLGPKKVRSKLEYLPTWLLELFDSVSPPCVWFFSSEFRTEVGQSSVDSELLEGRSDWRCLAPSLSFASTML